MTRSPYEAFQVLQGYSDLKISDDMRVARFVGNPHTDRQEIGVLSVFRAIEICRGEKFRIADIYETKFPNKGGALKSDYRPYTDTQEDPTGYAYVPVDAYFACRNEVYLMGMALNPVRPSEVAAHINDGRGGIRVEDFVMFSPNQDQLKVDDLILEINGTRVSNVSEAKAAVARATDKNRIPAKIISNNKVSTTWLKAASATSQVLTAQDSLVSAVCENYPRASVSPLCK